MREAADYNSTCQTKPLMRKTKAVGKNTAVGVPYDAFSDPINLPLRPHNSC